jgi:hypothetical protein
MMMMRKTMKKISAFFLLLALPLLAGCEQRLFHFVVTIDQTPTFPVDQTGAFSRRVRITEQDVLRALDVPEGGKITGVDIESLSLKVVVKSQNQANALSVSGRISDGQGTSNMFTNYPIPLAGVDTPFIGLNALIEEGIGKLRRKLDGYVKKIDNSAFDIEVSGDSFPTTGQRVVLDLLLKIKATVKYDECLEVPLGEGGEDCNL